MKQHLVQLQELRHAVCMAHRTSVFKSLRALWLLEEDYDFRHSITTCVTCVKHEGWLQKAKPWVDAQSPVNPVAALVAEGESKAKRLRAHLDLWTKLAFHCTPPQSRFWDERLVVLITYLIRMACGDPELFIFCQGFSEMEKILSDANLDDSISEKLQSYLDDPNPKQLRNAIEDVLREKEESDEEHVLILGRRLYKERRKGAYPLHAWGHWFAFFPSCPSAVRSVYSSVSVAILARK
jgi:hypothetical protein